MHDAHSPQLNSGAEPDGADPTGGAQAAADRSPGPAVHVPATGSPGDLTVLERLEAFRELIRHGNSLLGEVVAYCRDAEAALNQIEAEKQELDRVRQETQQARARADAEADAAHHALAQIEAQRCELNAMRDDLLKAHEEMAQFQQAQRDGAAALEASLHEARLQQQQLEQELQRVRAQTASTRTLDSRLSQLNEMQARLRTTEGELAETRLALEAERSRRDRAIALIKPKEVRS
jgi:chromosome segregation protein